MGTNNAFRGLCKLAKMSIEVSKAYNNILKVHPRYPVNIRNYVVNFNGEPSLRCSFRSSTFVSDEEFMENGATKVVRDPNGLVGFVEIPKTEYLCVKSLCTELDVLQAFNNKTVMSESNPPIIPESYLNARNEALDNALLVCYMENNFEGVLQLKKLGASLESLGSSCIREKNSRVLHYIFKNYYAECEDCLNTWEEVLESVDSDTKKMFEFLIF
jgi:hypothetical protein